MNVLLGTQLFYLGTLVRRFLERQDAARDTAEAERWRGWAFQLHDTSLTLAGATNDYDQLRALEALRRLAQEVRDATGDTSLQRIWQALAVEEVPA